MQRRANPRSTPAPPPPVVRATERALHLTETTLAVAVARASFTRAPREVTLIDSPVSTSKGQEGVKARGAVQFSSRPRTPRRGQGGPEGEGGFKKFIRVLEGIVEFPISFWAF